MDDLLRTILKLVLLKIGIFSPIFAIGAYLTGKWWLMALLLIYLPVGGAVYGVVRVFGPEKCDGLGRVISFFLLALLVSQVLVSVVTANVFWLVLWGGMTVPFFFLLRGADMWLSEAS